MKYTRFYNMHIPKTGGTDFRENVLRPNISHINSCGILTTPEGGGGYGINNSSKTLHWAWYDEYTQPDSYIFVTLRDPVKRIISHYAWQAARSISDNLSNYKYSDISVDNFYKWLEVFYEEQRNFQSKNLVYFNKDKDTYKESKLLGWANNDVPRVEHFFFQEHFKNFKINKNTLNKNIKRVNLFTKSEDLILPKNQEKILNKIFIDLEIKQNPLLILGKHYNNKNEFSEILYKQLSKNNIDELYTISKIDTDLYFSDIYTKY